VVPLADKDKSVALAAYATARIQLSDDVIAYLLAHGRRDMPTLVATLALDRHSLATQRCHCRCCAVGCSATLSG
jgi:DnaA family protein